MPSRFERNYARVRWSLHYYGLGTTMLLAAARVIPILRKRRWYLRHKALCFDRRFGVDTASGVSVSELRLSPNQSRHAVEYAATSSADFGVALQVLGIRHPEYVFVDYGCGKGRALLMASEFPFQSLLGIELSPALCEQAERNLARYRSRTRQCDSVRVLCADAGSAELPDEPLVVYFFNPFDHVVLSRVLSRLERSWRAHPRRMICIYHNPMHHDIFAEHSFLQPLELGLDSRYWAVFATESTSTSD